MSLFINYFNVLFTARKSNEGYNQSLQIKFKYKNHLILIVHETHKVNYSCVV